MCIVNTVMLNKIKFCSKYLLLGSFGSLSWGQSHWAQGHWGVAVIGGHCHFGKCFFGKGNLDNWVQQVPMMPGVTGVARL